MKAKQLAIKLSILLWTLTVLGLPGYSQQKGIAEGRLINRTDPAILPGGATIDIVGMSGGMSILKSTSADSSGKFRIEGLPIKEPLMVRAIYKGANYHAQLSFNAAGSAHANIEVYEPTNSTADILVDGIQMVFQASGAHLISTETISFHNKTNPPRTYVNPEGTLRVSKAAGIVDLPKIRVTAPGASMPLVQPALESPEGNSYYSQYPLRPGITTFEIQQVLPYESRSYVYTKKFSQDVSSLKIGVLPKDMAVSGKGLAQIPMDTAENFSVFASSPVKAGSEVVWTFSGGTIVEQPEASPEEDSIIEARPNAVGRNALIIGPLLLAGFIVVLWLAFNRFPAQSPDSGIREKMLAYAADLDRKYEAHTLGRQEYLSLREKARRRLRSIFIMNRG